MPWLKVMKQFNWVDIFSLILIFRICYIASKRGMSVEFFKLLGTIFSIYLALHYYTLISDWIQELVRELVPQRVPLDFFDFLCCNFFSQRRRQY